MDNKNDILKLIESLDFLLDFCDKADKDQEDDLNACLNNYILFVTENEYLHRLIDNSDNDEILELIKKIVLVQFETLKSLKLVGLTYEDKDKFSSLAEMTLIQIKCLLYLYARVKQGAWLIPFTDDV